MCRKNNLLAFALHVMLSVTAGCLLCGETLAQNDGKADAVHEVARQPDDSSSDAESFAQSPEAEHDSSDTNAQALPQARNVQHIEEEAKKEQLRKSALAGLLVLSLICIVFLVLIIVVALWARRIRMLTRQPLVEQHPGDPLWYLRKGKGSDSSDVAGLADGGSSHGET